MNFKPGQWVKIRTDTQGHKLPIGTPMHVLEVSVENNSVKTRQYPLYWFRADQLEPRMINKVALADSLKRYRALAYLEQTRLEYLEESGKQELDDEREYQNYHLKKIISNENTPIEDRIERIRAIFGESI